MVGGLGVVGWLFLKILFYIERWLVGFGRGEAFMSVVVLVVVKWLIDDGGWLVVDAKS